MTEHIVTTLKTPLVERATHPPSQVREKEIVNICMYVHTKERHEREREKETERRRNTGRCGVKEPVSAAKTAYTGFSTGHRISSQPVCQTQIRKPKRAERSDSELQIFHLCRNLGDTTEDLWKQTRAGAENQKIRMKAGGSNGAKGFLLGRTIHPNRRPLFGYRR